jgi:hypothetical protein
MSDTPRTDEVENFIHHQKTTPAGSGRFSKEKEGFVLSNFARKLERELNAANRQLAEYEENRIIND